MKNCDENIKFSYSYYFYHDLEHSDWLVRNPAEYNDIQLKLPDTTFSY